MDYEWMCVAKEVLLRKSPNPQVLLRNVICGLKSTRRYNFQKHKKCRETCRYITNFIYIKFKLNSSHIEKAGQKVWDIWDLGVCGFCFGAASSFLDIHPQFLVGGLTKFSATGSAGSSDGFIWVVFALVTMALPRSNAFLEVVSSGVAPHSESVEASVMFFAFGQ